MPSIRPLSLVFALALYSLCVPRPARAQVEFTVTVENLPPDFRALEPLIKANYLAAARAWASYVDAKPCTVALVFRVDPAANAGRGSGRSLTTARLDDETVDGKRVLEQGWAHMMRTGKDPNGDKPDVEIVLNPDYMRTIWWDPQPDRRAARVPGNKLDSMSVLLHELGHALAFNGWINPQTGELTGQYISSYDRNVKYDGRNFFFYGPEAMKLWGRPIPLARTNNNYHHVCERPVGRDALLKADLMNGVVFEYGRRYAIGRLDLAILADCGIPLKQDPAGARRSR